MNRCLSIEMRDSLPDFVHGQLDSAQMAKVLAHVSSCAACAAEVELLRHVIASAPASPVMDVGRIAGALPVPTRHGFLLHRGGGRVSDGAASLPVSAPTVRNARIWSRPLVKVAAAMAIVTAGGLSLVVGRDVLRPEAQVGQGVVAAPSAAPSSIATAPASVAVAPGSDSRSSTQSPKAVAIASLSGISLSGELQELSDEHLATLLDDIERMDALPAIEPESAEPLVAGAGSSEIDQ